MTVKLPLKQALAKDNKFGKPLFKSKKKHIYNPIFIMNLSDTYQKPVETTTNDTTSSQETGVKEIPSNIIKNEESKATLPVKKDKTVINKVSTDKESKTSDSDKEIPKKTESIQRLTLFDDDDI